MSETESVRNQKCQKLNVSENSQKWKVSETENVRKSQNRKKSEKEKKLKLRWFSGPYQELNPSLGDVFGNILG